MTIFNVAFSQDTNAFFTKDITKSVVSVKKNEPICDVEWEPWPFITLAYHRPPIARLTRRICGTV